jgi:hypothetical protein
VAPLPVLAQKLLSALLTRAPHARDAADLGDPGPLTDLLDHAARDTEAEVLLDPSAARDLAGDDLPLAQALAAWSAGALPAEARWRADAARWRGSLGQLQVDLSSLEGLGAHADPDRRAAAWDAFSAAWDPRVEALGRWLHRPEVPPAAPPPPLESVGGLVLPGAELVALFTAPGHFDPALLTAPSAAAAPPPARWSGGAALQELTRELVAACGFGLHGFDAWRHAAEAAVADFTEVNPPAPPPIRLPERGLVPLRRITGAAVGPTRPSARAWALRGLADPRPHAAARLLSQVGAWYPRRHLAHPPGDVSVAVRAAALAVAGLALEAALAVEAEGDARALDTALRAFGPAGAPLAWRRLAVRGGWAEQRPGEGDSLYLHGARTLAELAEGARQAEALRAVHDEDWSVRGVTLASASPAEARDLSPLVAWLREAARL